MTDPADIEDEHVEVTLDSGEIQFFDNFVPTLHDGEYQIHIDHEMKGGTAKGFDDKKKPYELPGEQKKTNFTVNQRFTVRGPRFTLPSADVHLRNPPANHSGRFEHALPTVVLSKRGLPWERLLAPDKTDENTPWMALVLLRADELLVVDPESISTGNEGVARPKGLENLTRAGKFTLDHVLRDMKHGLIGPPNHIQGPHLKYGNLSTDEIAQLPSKDTNQNKDGDKAKSKDPIIVSAIDISVETFKTMVPRLSEAEFLTHVRQVNTQNKEALGIKDDGWFSVISAKRFPVFVDNYDQVIAKSSDPGMMYAPGKIPYVAHLVSLEGFEKYLGSTPESFGSATQVRMVSLASWPFSVIAERGESFADLMCGLINPVEPDPVSKEPARLDDLRLKIPLNNEQRQPPLDTAKKQLLEGFAPVTYQTRPGQSTFAWLRGPLTPYKIAPLFTNVAHKAGWIAPPTKASEAYIYDPKTGLFDLSYGVAFTTGRSLALSDSVFGKRIMEWRRHVHGLLDLAHTRVTSAHIQGLLTRSGELSQDVAEAIEILIEEKLLTREVVKHLVNILGSKMLLETSGLPPEVADVPATNNRRLKVAHEELKDLLENPDFKRGLANLAGTVPDDIIEWLSERALLSGVPFHNLVPSEQMLPVESIRFFHLDTNWMSCLVDGALSIGTHCSRDTALYHALRDPIMNGVFRTINRLRDRVRGVASSPNMDVPIGLSGFVLRSAVVSGWPGLEIKAFSEPNSGGKIIKPLRMERLSPDLLLVIFADIPATVQINEPHEALSFGYEMLLSGGCAGDPARKHDVNVFELRHVSGSKTGHPLELVPPQAPKTPPPKPEPVTVELIWTSESDHVLDIDAMQKKIAEMLPVSEGPFGPAAFAMNMIKVPEQMLFENPAEGKT